MSSAKKILERLSKNQLSILNFLLKNDKVSKNEISDALKMKLTSLNNILYPMRSEKIIVESIYGESNGGRRPVLYSIPEDKYLVIGIDISIMYTMVVLSDIKMNIIYQEKFMMNENYTPEKTIEEIAEIVLRIKSMYDPDDKKILGIGLGTVGPIDMENNILKENKSFYNSKWKNVKLKEMLEEKINEEVIWNNGVNCAVLLEHLYGSDKNNKNSNIGYFNCGEGIRVGAIASEKIICSMNNEEESFSKMVILDSDKKVRTINDYVTIKAINNNYLRLTKEDIQGKDNLEIFKEISKKALNEDLIANKVINEAAEIMGMGIINFIRLLNTDLIILGGPLIENCPKFYDICVEFIEKNITSKKIKFRNLGRYGYSAIALGAANMVIQKLLQNNFY